MASTVKMTRHLSGAPTGCAARTHGGRYGVWTVTEVKMQNPYDALGDALVVSVASGNPGKLTGNQIGLSERLRQYAYFRQENAVETGDALLVNDLLDAARRLERLP